MSSLRLLVGLTRSRTSVRIYQKGVYLYAVSDCCTYPVHWLDTSVFASGTVAICGSCQKGLVDQPIGGDRQHPRFTLSATSDAPGGISGLRNWVSWWTNIPTEDLSVFVTYEPTI